MAVAARKGFLEFSPTGKDDADKENDVPVLILTQFSKAPFVTFGTVKIGTSKSAVLQIENPTEDVEAEVIVEKIASGKGFSVDHNEFTIEAEGSFSLTITWTPTEEGGVRELIVFNANGVLKHRAVLLGRAEAPKKKKKTLWDSIKNKPGPAPVSGHRQKRTEPTLKMAANKTFQVPRQTHYKRLKPRSPLSSLNQASSNRERPLSPKIHEDKQPFLVSAVQDEQENSPFARELPERPVTRRTSQDLLSLPENKDLSKLLNKTVSPIGTPDRLKRLMPRIETVESPIVATAAAIGTENTLVKTPTLSVKDALALIDSDLSPIQSSPQESSREFSDSLESTSGRLDHNSNPETLEINEPRLTFFVGKTAAVPNVKMFTSTTVTKGKAPVLANPSSTRKIKKSRRRLLETTLELTDSSTQSESRPGTPCLPVIGAETALQNEQCAKEEQATSSPQSSKALVTFFVTSPQPSDPCVASVQNSSPENPIPKAFPLATPPQNPASSPELREIPSTTASVTVPIASSHVPAFLASSPERFPVQIPGKGKKRKSEEFLKDDVKVEEEEVEVVTERVKRSRALVVKREPSKATQERRPQPKTTVQSNSCHKTVKSAVSVRTKSHSTKPGSHSALSVKSAAQKSKIVAVAQSKLTFIKPTQTAIPRHPMPFAAKNMFFDERWIEKQERGFTWWLNYVLTPDDFRVNTEVAKVNALSLALGSEVSVPKAPTKEEMSFSTYTARRKLNRLRRAACALFTSDTVVKAIRRLELEVEAKRLLVRRDRHLWKDIGERQKVLNWLLSYNPLWLRIGLETIYGELISLENNGDTFGLAMFILQRLLWNPDIAAEFRHPKVPHLYRDGHEEALSRFTLKKLLLLVCFLDKAKESRLIEHDPCLFCMDAEFKTSKDLLLAFSRDFLSGEGILSRHLGYLGLPVSHQQKPLDEFNFAVKNLAVDLKCGIRLVRVMELLVQDWSLSVKLRLPAISRLQKIHNTELALKVLKNRGVDLKDDHGSVIDSRDIVDGHREKTLALLWKIMFAFHVEVILNEDQLKDEIWFLRKTIRTKRRLENLRSDRGPQPSPAKDRPGLEHSSPKICLLMDWVRAVCDFYSVKVENFTVSFSDGRALCFLIHHYHPALVPGGSVCLRTTQSVDSAPRGRLQLDCSASDSDASFDSIASGASAPDSPFKELLENEKSNFRLVNSAVSFLGGVPAMINAADMSNTIPNEKVVMSYLSFLCARLLDLRNETRAARVIQAAWRKYRLTKDLQLYQERNEAALKIQSLVRKFLQRRRVVRERRAAVVIQTAWRAALVRKELRRRQEAKLKLLHIKAATVIQAHWRMYWAMKSYQRLQQYAIVIQAQWRMRKAVLTYRRTLWAVSIIQSQTRAWSAAKTQRENFLSLRAAAVKIQRGFRRWRAHKIERENRAARVIQAAVRKWFAKKVADKTAAAIKIQAWYKMQRCLHKYRQIRRSAMLIQAQFRGCVQRRHFWIMKQQHLSATVIQSAFRGYLVRKQMAKMISAVVVIQRHLRATLRRNADRWEFLRMRRAAITIQAAYRGRLARGLLKTQHKAATLIQAFYRRYTAQKRYNLARKAAVLIQQRYRATVLAKKKRGDYLALRNATVTIQATWRGRIVRRKLEEQIRCATIVQAWFRRHAAQKRYEATKQSAQVIQRYFRAHKAATEARKAFLETRAATVALQAAFRGMVVRKELKRKHEAATVLQAYVRMAMQWNRYHLQRSAAIIIQSRYRALFLGHKQRLEFQQVKEAVLKIQAFYKGYLVRRELRRQHNAAVVIQSMFRMYQRRMAYLATKCATVILQQRYRAKKLMDKQLHRFRSMKSSAVTIQAAYRGYRTRKQMQEMTNATVVIQRAFRTHRARHQFMILKNAAVVCQRRYRARMVARKQRSDFLSQRKAVSRLQAAFRGWLVRKDLKQRRCAATVIQSHFRRYQAQTSYKNLKSATRVLQQRFRTNRQMKVEMQALKIKRKATIVLQASFRGMRARRLLKTKHSAAVAIQRAFKTYCQRKRYLALKLAATIIQQRYKAFSVAKKERSRYLQLKKSAMVLQAVYRGRKVRAEVAHWHKAATVLQSAFRKHREEVKYRAMRLSAIIIQRFYRAFLLKNQQREHFLKTRQSVIILQAAFRGQQARVRIANMRRAATVIQANYRRHRQQQIFKKHCWAARVLQKHTRARRQMKLDAERYQQQRSAVVVLQAAYRGMKERQNIKKMHQAAGVVQRAYKALRERKQYLSLRASVVTLQRRFRATVEAKKQREQFFKMRKAAVSIQASYRGHKARKEVKHWHQAATVIQSAFRQHRHEAAYQAMRLSAIIIQRRYRCLLQQRQERHAFLKLKNSAIVIQAIFRGQSVRKEIKKMHNAAVVIQKSFRMHTQRTDFRRQRWAACVFQRRFRAQKQMKQDLQSYQQQRNAAIVLQAAYRGMKLRQQVRQKHCAACVIQRLYRAHLKHLRYLALKRSALTIQRKYRATAATKKQMGSYQQMRRAAVVLQAHFRGHQVRRDVRERHKAATRIQTAFRRHKEQCKYQALRLAAIIIQRRYRALIIQKEQRVKFLQSKRCAIVLQAAIRGYQVRRRLSKMHSAATVIQANFRRHRQVTVFKKQRWAACVLQQRLRAHKQMKLEIQHFHKQKEAVIVLQAAYRGMKERVQVRQMNQAARVVQRAYKTYCQRKQYLTLKASVVSVQRRYRATIAARNQREQLENMRNAAVTIQAAYKGYKVRKEVAHWHQAATIIQATFRKHRHEVAYQATRLSAIVIQRHFRSWLLQKRDRRWFLKVKHSTVVLQAAFRGWRVRRRLADQTKAAVMIQSQWRRFVQRRRFLKKKDAVLKMQRRVRAVQRGKRQREDYERQRRSAVTLQRHWRIWMTKKKEKEAAQANRRLRFTAAVFFHLHAIKIQRALRVHWALLSAKKQIHSVLTVQRCVRAWLQRRRYQEERRKVVLLQRAVRQWLRRRQKAASVIQAAARTFLLHRRQKRVQQGIIKAQALWRGHRSRRLNDGPKVAKLRQRLLKATAAAREEDKLCNKTSAALDYLLKYRQLSDILEALKNLETATRLSPECCERLVESGATNTIFTLIRCCNRSIPCMEVITLSTQILLNLSKYHKTVEAVYQVESSVETLLELLQRYRDKAGDKVAQKGGSIFTKACFLLALLLQDKHRAVEVMRIPKATERLRSIYKLTARKHQLDRERTAVKQKMNASINGSFFLHATPRKTRPAPKFAPDWVLRKDKLKDIVDPLRAIQMVAETLSIVL